MGKAPEGLRPFLAKRYNGALPEAEDTSPDFLGAVTDLTAARCQELNREMPDCEQYITKCYFFRAKRTAVDFR